MTCTTFRFEGCIQKRYSLSRFGNEEVIANEAHGQGEVQVQSLRLVLKYHKIGSLSAEAYKRQGSYLLVFCKPSILKFQLFTQLHQLSSIDRRRFRRLRLLILQKACSRCRDSYGSSARASILFCSSTRILVAIQTTFIRHTARRRACRPTRWSQ